MAIELIGTNGSMPVQDRFQQVSSGNSTGWPSTSLNGLVDREGSEAAMER
jgi:hypothetical protein